MKVKIHESYRNVIAICDSELLGKQLEEGKMQLEVGAFFDGEEKTEAECLGIMEDTIKEDATFNIVGDKATKLALKAGIISKEGIKKIRGVPFALVLM